MTFCIKCGKELQEGSAFCHACGYPVNAQEPNQNQYQNQNQWNGNRNYYTPRYQEKDVAITLILSIILGLIGLMGIGQIYVGRAKRGALIMIAGILLAVASYIMLFVYLTSDYFWGYYDPYYGTYSGPDLGAVLAFTAVISLIHLIFFIWQAYDSYKLAKKYNQELNSTGKPPW